MSDPRITYVDELLASSDLSEVYMGAFTLAAILYGEDSPQLGAIRQLDHVLKLPDSSPAMRGVHNVAEQKLKGMLESFRHELEERLSYSVRVEASSQVLIDFLDMARRALDGGQIDVAAVLACAALEDSLKRYAQIHHLPVRDQPLSELIDTLEAAGLVNGDQGELLCSYNAIRRKAFRAEWDALEAADVRRVMAFVEGFLLQRF